jgi:hypothetical protein
MPPTKSFRCVECGETNIENFYRGHKSLCKKHYAIPRTADIRKRIVKPYYCVVCHDDDESHFHVYKKTKCKKHFNMRVPSVIPDSESEDDSSSVQVETPKNIRIKIISKRTDESFTDQVLLNSSPKLESSEHLPKQTQCNSRRIIIKRTQP